LKIEKFVNKTTGIWRRYWNKIDKVDKLQLNIDGSLNLIA